MLWMLLACVFTDQARDPSSLDDTSAPQSDTSCGDGVFIPADICNGLDDDCDGLIDEAPEHSWYVDADMDGFGVGELVEGCDVPEGSSDVSGDCDDTQPTVYPGGPEYCDDLDNDCDGVTDPNGSVDATRWIQDSDQDGYGNEVDGVLVQCDQPNGYVEEEGDCDNANPQIFPGAPEICLNGIDDDCSGVADDGCIVEHCGSLVTNTTWDDSAIHRITCDVEIAGTSGPTLTISEGARIWFDDDTRLVVGGEHPGRLMVEGSASDPVEFTSSAEHFDQPFVGIYGGIELHTNDYGSSFKHAAFRWGGQYGAVLQAEGAPLTIENCLFEDNDNYAVSLAEQTTLISWSENTLQRNVWPAVMGPNAADALDVDSAYTGNSDDHLHLLESTIDQDVTLDAIDAAWVPLGNWSVEGTNSPTLTVQDGATVLFTKDTGLAIGWNAPGALVVDGGGVGVTFGSVDQQTRGEWSGISFSANALTSTLTGLDLEYGGGNGEGCIDVHGGSVFISGGSVSSCLHHGIKVRGGSLEIESATITDVQKMGIQVTFGSLDLLTGTTITGSGSEAIRLPPGSMNAVDSTNVFSGNGTDAVMVNGGNLNSDTTVHALSVPWTLEGDVYVRGGAALTLEDGVEMRFGSGAALVIGDTSPGELDVQGSSAGVTLRSDATQPAAGDWDGLQIGASATSVTLDGLDLQHAGVDLDADATIINSSFSDAPGACIDSDAVLVLQDSVMDTCANHCVTSTGTLGGTEDFTGNTLQFCGQNPLEASAVSLDAIATDNSFEDNVLLTSGDLTSDATWRLLAVDWEVDGDLTVEGATLTVEPGVNVYWTNGGLNVGHTSTAALDVQGTSSSTVHFQGDPNASAAGDWDGLSFGGYCDTTNSELEWTEVSYGGAAGTGNVTLESCDLTFTNVLLSNGAGYGLYTTDSSPSLTNVQYSGNALGDTN